MLEASHDKATEPEFINGMLKLHKYNSFQTNLLKEFLKKSSFFRKKKKKFPALRQIILHDIYDIKVCTAKQMRLEIKP